jgi:hypothetical protein
MRPSVGENVCVSWKTPVLVGAKSRPAAFRLPAQHGSSLKAPVPAPMGIYRISVCGAKGRRE